MTFRELLNLYRSGELSPEQTREVEEAIDREDALLEYLAERDALPELDEERPHRRTTASCGWSKSFSLSSGAAFAGPSPVWASVWARCCW